MTYTIDAPTAAECRRLRETHGLSLAAMAEVARLASRQTWAKYEAGAAACDQVRWEWCLLMLGQHPDLRLSRPLALPSRRVAPEAPADA